MSENRQPRFIRDLLYFDEPKALSILSQFEDGVISEVEAVSENSVDKTMAGGVKLGGVGGNVEKQTNETETKIERKKRHHEIVNVLERELFDQGYAADVNQVAASFDIRNGDAHKQLSQYGFLRVTGWVEFNDYRRLQEFFREYNGLIHFINESRLNNSEDKEALLAVQKELQERRSKNIEVKDKNKRFLQGRELQKVDQDLTDKIKARLDHGKIADWILEGFDHFIQILHVDRLKLQLYPFDDHLSFHIGAELKREALVEMNAERLVRIYDNRPSLPLTLVGLITSDPSPVTAQPDFSKRYDEAFSNPAIEEIRPFLASFNNIFGSLHNIEHITASSEHPAISVYPIFLYREIVPVQKN